MDMQTDDKLADFRVRLDQECSDGLLVEQAQAGHWAAFEQLVRRYQDPFHRLAYGYLKSEADAQDAVQMAFLKMYRKLDTFRGDAKFKNWAYRIVVNTALSRIRKSKRRREVALENVAPQIEEVDEPILTLADWRIRADEAVENRELRAKIAGAVAELEPKYKSIFLLYEVEGLSLKEIGEVVELSVPGVKSRLHRARLHLRATLERYLSDMDNVTLAAAE